MVETGLNHKNTKFFFETHNLHTFLAIDALDDPVYMRKVANNTIGSDSHSEKIIRSLREDLGFVKHVDQDGLKKHIEYTDEGKAFLSVLKNAGYRPEEAVYPSE